jgi:Methyltransferase domain
VDAHQLIERLISDNPQLHFVSEETARQYSPFGIKPGATSWAATSTVLRYLAEHVKDDHLTLETGAGHTTVAFAALAKKHICIAPDPKGIELIRSYLDRLGVGQGQVDFIAEPSDVALPKLSPSGKLDCAFIDGCHGYPFPALDWHYIDRHLKVGGLLGCDNTEIRAVRNHCDFLEENGTYELVKEITGVPGTNFYAKHKDEDREWVWQHYNHQARARLGGGGFLGSLKSAVRRVLFKS